LYHENNYVDVFHGITANDGHADRGPIPINWWNQDNYRLKAIDSEGNIGWSDYFSIIVNDDFIINVTYPNASTVLYHNEQTYLEWNGAQGSWIIADIYKSFIYLDVFHGQTNNDGHADRGPIPSDWGTGNDYRIIILDENDNYGYSDFFTIEE